MLTVDLLEACDLPPTRGTPLLATHHTGSPVGLFVGRSPAGIDWICWPSQGERRPSRETFAFMCATFDALRL
jgi:hypothetical protein